MSRTKYLLIERPGFNPTAVSREVYLDMERRHGAIKDMRPITMKEIHQKGIRIYWDGDYYEHMAFDDANKALAAANAKGPIIGRLSFVRKALYTDDAIDVLAYLLVDGQEYQTFFTLLSASTYPPGFLNEERETLWQFHGAKLYAGSGILCNGITSIVQEIRNGTDK